MKSYTIKLSLVNLKTLAFKGYSKREWRNLFSLFYAKKHENTIRIHSHCGYLSLNEFKDKYWNDLKELELVAG